MDLTASDKLERLRVSCQEKVRRIAVLEKQFSENELILKNEIKTSLPQSAISALALKAAKLQLLIDERKEQNNISKEKHSQCALRVHAQKAALAEAFSKFEELQKGIPNEKKSIALFCSVVECFVVQLRETREMALEERRSLAAAVAGGDCQSGKSGSSAEWHKRLIAATQIQRQEAERLLTEQEAEYFALSRTKKQPATH